MKNIQIGCHVSAAGGVFNAPKNAHALECETFQIFTRPPMGGSAPVLTKDIIEKFKSEMDKYELDTFVIHCPYFINFGSPKPQTYHGSITILRGELDRGSLLGAKFVMFHPGSLKDNKEQGFNQVTDGLSKVLADYKGSTQLLIEISAGAGEVVGDTFEELALLVKALKKHKGFGGICYDTQHAFASGYDIRTPALAAKVFKEFNEKIGLKYFRMSHVNDSKVEFASNKDRHEHIGEGKIGVEGFTAFFKELKKNKLEIPLILETEHDKVNIDLEKLKFIRNKQH